MLWGDGTVSDGDALRYQEFLNLTTTPQYILGYEEPDCSPPDSSDIASDKGAEVWNEVIAPWAEKGSLLGSPSMCSTSLSLSLLLTCLIGLCDGAKSGIEQSDEDWLTPFEEDITTSWDFTAIHINTISMDVVNKDLVRPVFFSRVEIYLLTRDLYRTTTGITTATNPSGSPNSPA
jgi:hypothetical protein